MHPMTLYDCAVRDHERTLADRRRAGEIARRRRERTDDAGPGPVPVPVVAVDPDPVGPAGTGPDAPGGPGAPGAPEPDLAVLLAAGADAPDRSPALV